MELHLDDDGFVRAPPLLVYERVADPSTYSAWWRGFRLLLAEPFGGSWDAEAIAAGPPAPGEFEGRPPKPGRSRFAFQLRSGLVGRPFTIGAKPYRFRPGKGVHLAVTGDLVGTIEWWLEEGWGGTVVHQLVRAELRGDDGVVARRRAAACRVALRRGLWGLKDAVEGDVREVAGLAR